MAKYTELLTEYIENGGTLPTAFSLITGFEDLFVKHFCNYEIGFETETLFALKLEEKADLYMNLYAERVSAVATAYTHVKAPAKTYYESNSLTQTIGEQDSNVKQVPFNAVDANPSSINHVDESVNTNAETRNRTDSGVSADEAIRVYELLNSKVKNILNDLLDEFEDLFMGVYL